MKNLLIIAFIGLICFVSCKDNSTNPEAPNEIIPLKIGNSWEHLQILYNLNPAGDSTFRTTTIVRDTIINNTKWFITNGGSIVRNGNDGYYGWSKQSHQETLAFKFPAKKEDSWQNFSEGADASGKLITHLHDIIILQTDTLVRTDQGNYSCYKYHSSVADIDLKKKSKAESMLSPGIGNIESNLYILQDQEWKLLGKQILLKATIK